LYSKNRLAIFSNITEAIIAGETHIRWINDPPVTTSIPTPNTRKTALSIQVFESSLPHYQFVPSDLVPHDEFSTSFSKRYSYFLDNGTSAQFSKLGPQKQPSEAYAQVLVKALQLI
jgi:hypothetical protein